MSIFADGPIKELDRHRWEYSFAPSQYTLISLCSETWQPSSYAIVSDSQQQQHVGKVLEQWGSLCQCQSLTAILTALPEHEALQY